MTVLTVQLSTLKTINRLWPFGKVKFYVYPVKNEECAQRIWPSAKGMPWRTIKGMTRVEIFPLEANMPFTENCKTDKFSWWPLYTRVSRNYFFIRFFYFSLTDEFCKYRYDRSDSNNFLIISRDYSCNKLCYLHTEKVYIVLYTIMLYFMHSRNKIYNWLLY